MPNAQRHTKRQIHLALGIWHVAWLSLLSSGCLVSSLHPLYDEGSLVFDEQLVGTWENSDSQVSIVIARGEWRSYRIAYTDRTGTTRLTGHLTTVGSVRLLNVRPEDGFDRPAFVIASNGLLEVNVAPTEVRVRELDYDEALRRVTARTLKIAAVTDLKQNVLITADTQTLRTWMTMAVRDGGLWGEWKTLGRK